ARKQKVVDGLWKGLQGLMKSRKITTIKGAGSLTRGKLVRIDDGSELEGEHVILASGSVPRTLPGFGVDGRIVMTSDEVLDLDALPSSAVGVGGRAIGTEFATMMRHLAVQITLLERLPEPPPGCDRAIRNASARTC